MIDKGDFEKKQIMFYFPASGDKMSFRNDNMLITDGNGKVKYQSTCYRIFFVFVAGDTVITTGLLQRANKILNQKTALNRIRKKTPELQEAIVKLDEHILKLKRISLCMFKVITGLL